MSSLSVSRSQRRAVADAFALKLAWIAAVAAALLVAGLVLAFELERSLSGGPDEGIYLAAARLLNNGFPFSTFYFDQPSLFPAILALGQRLTGDTVLGGRIIIAGFSLAALLLIGLITRALGWLGAGPLAILFALVSPVFLEQSRHVMAEAPGAALLLGAFAATLIYRGRGERGGWLFQLALLSSGALFAASVIVKPLIIPFGLTLVWWIADAAHERQGKQTILNKSRLALDLLFWVAAGLFVTFLVINPLDIPGEWARTVGFHLAESSYYTSLLGDPLTGLYQFSTQHLGWLGLALIGLIVAVVRAPTLTLPLVLGESALVGLLILLPPFEHHYTLLIPVLAIFAGVGLETAAAALAAVVRLRQPALGPKGLLAAGVSLLGVLLALWQAPSIFEQDRHLMIHVKPTQQEVAAWFGEKIRPGDFYLSDDPFSLYAAGGLVPPPALNLAYPSTFLVDPDWRFKLTQAFRDYPVHGIISLGGYERIEPVREWLQDEFTRSSAGDEAASRLQINSYSPK